MGRDGRANGKEAGRGGRERGDGTVDEAGRPRPVEPAVRRGSPGAALVERAKGADLVVVGTRGHGGFTGLMLGSVSHQVTHHAPCPVVIVRGDTGR